MHLSTTSRPPEILELESEIAQLKREQTYAASRKQFDRAKTFEGQITQKADRLAEASEAWKTKIGSDKAEVTVEDIAEVVSKLTGIPVTELTEEEKAKLLRMEERLHQRVIGQDEAVATLQAG